MGSLKCLGCNEKEEALISER